MKYLLVFTALFFLLATLFMHFLPEPTHKLRNLNPLYYWFIVVVMGLDVIILIGTVVWYVWKFIK